MSTIADSSTKQAGKTTKASGCCGGHDGEDSKQHAVAPASDDKTRGSQHSEPEHGHHKGGRSGCGCSTEARK